VASARSSPAVAAAITNNESNTVSEQSMAGAARSSRAQGRSPATRHLGPVRLKLSNSPNHVNILVLFLDPTTIHSYCSDKFCQKKLVWLESIHPKISTAKLDQPVDSLPRPSLNENKTAWHLPLYRCAADHLLIHQILAVDKCTAQHAPHFNFGEGICQFNHPFSRSLFSLSLYNNLLLDLV
jgi:hypothetical protein